MWELLQNARDLSEHAIKESYDATIAYDRTAMLFNQYNSAGNAKLLRQAAAELKSVQLTSVRTQQLENAIKAIAKSKNITI